MSYMIGKLFLDTNIVCYAFDTTEPAKRKVCEGIMDKVYNGEIRGVISNQVLTETYNTLTRKFKMPTVTARDIVKSLATTSHLHTINYTSHTVNQVLDDMGSIDVPFLDLLIAETMRENSITEIITENAKDFENIPWLKATNPFKS